MNAKTKYVINPEVRFGSLELIDVPAIVAASREQWSNWTLCRVNDSVVRLAVVQGEFHWHKHDEEDEFFFTLEGKFLIDLEDRTIVLERHQGYTIPRGLVHRTRAPERAAVLMVEKSTVKPTGD
jgi:mannose-6-phosphate isomerase-like protein (cupin superfamily)